mgnify:CR=1 FL=1
MKAKRLLLAIVLLIPVAAAAHPVDDVPPFKHLGLDYQPFYACRKAYWHCFRNLANDIQNYSLCAGGVAALHAARGWPAPVLNRDIIDYFQVVPATPVEEKPRNVPYCLSFVKACEDTRAIVGNHVAACGVYENLLLGVR